MIVINDEELHALRGLSPHAKTLYLELVELVDPESGLVGDPYIVGRRQLTNSIAYRPARGSTRPPWLPADAELKALLGELVRARLVEDRSKQKVFIAHLPYVTRAGDDNG